jgi:hypothetical protein
MLQESDMLGEVLEQRETSLTLTLERSADVYKATAGHDTLYGEVLNMASAAAGMEPHSALELGGDRTKRVTQTRTPSGDRYLYVEVGER